jgi:hypothetical protein
VIQFLADNIDQLDLALDQLAVRDRNFDRFGLMLIDNVVELTLHKHAQDKSMENEMWSPQNSPRHDPQSVASALGQHFDSKIKLAKTTGMVSPEVLDTIQYLHTFRNTAYHKGLRHEGILHSLALFYFTNACTVLANYTPMYWTSTSRDRISHRALKYLGSPRILSGEKAFQAAWKRLHEVGVSMGDTLVPDLHADMEKTIETIDHQIQYLADESPRTNSRQQVIIDAQAWPFAFTDEAKEFAIKNNCPQLSVGAYVQWLGSNYPWPINTDPIPSWRKRLKSLKDEKSNHAALKKYCDFMRQTEELRSQIEESAAQLDAHIEEQIERARGK